MNTNKLRIKLGELEVEYEGSEAFLRAELPLLLKSIADLHKTADVFAGSRSAGPAVKANSQAGAGGAAAVNLSSSSIAAKLGFKDGGDLLLAACLHLALAKGKESFSRTEILSEMKSAKSYFKKSYGSNLSNYLNTLVTSGKLLQGAGGEYAIHADTLAELKPKL